MVKKFGGFTPQQQQTLLSKMGYTGPAQQDDLNKFIMASPKAASMLGKAQQMAIARVEGGPQVNMAEGGTFTKPPFQGSPAPETAIFPTPIVKPENPSPSYDPSQGLPNVPESPEALNTFLDGIQNQTGYVEGQAGYISKDTNNEGGFNDLIKKGKLPEDPSKYTISGGRENWTVTFDDGATMKINVAEESTARSRIENQVIPALELVKQQQPFQDFQGLFEQYDQQLEAYKEFQGGEAQKIVDTPVFDTIETGQNEVTRLQALIENYTNQMAALPAGSPQADILKGFIDEENINLNRARAGLSQAKRRGAEEREAERRERIAAVERDPSGVIQGSDVKGFTPDQVRAGLLNPEIASAGDAGQADLFKATQTGEVADVEKADTETYDIERSIRGVKAVTDKLEAATGKPSTEALAEAQTMSAEELAQLDLTLPQIEEAIQVIAPEKRKAETGELITDVPSVDQTRVEASLMNFEAATGEPSNNATVKGQLTKLMQDFESGQTPPWAAGAMRAATATLASRGLAASSMAGQAIIQAAMESAIPIATQDAQINANFELQSMTNRQAVAVLKAQTRAEFLGLEFTQDFEKRVKNAATISDIANRNFTADVQIALENSNLANTVDLANLDVSSAKLISDAAAMTQVEMESLNNRQQAAMQEAQAFLQFDLKEFDATQQVSVLKAQSNIQALLTDAAAANASLQFNAESENQVNQFYDKLQSDIEMFMVAQKDAIELSNTEAANAREQFNTKMQAAREEFNTQNALIIAQANAEWAQKISTEENAAINEANREEARAANAMSVAAYEAAQQMERDMISHSVLTQNNNADRATSIAVAIMNNEAAMAQADAAEAGDFASAIGSVVGAIVSASPTVQAQLR